MCYCVQLLNIVNFWTLQQVRVSVTGTVETSTTKRREKKETLKALKIACCSKSVSKVETNLQLQDKRTSVAHKNKIKSKLNSSLWEKGLQWDKIGEESKSRYREETKAAEENKERDFRRRVQINPKSCGKIQTTGEEKKKKPKDGTERK